MQNKGSYFDRKTGSYSAALSARPTFSLLRWMSLLFIVLAIVLLILQLVRFSRIWATYPPGLTIAGIPVGQINRQQAAQRLLEVYLLPVEIHYGDAIVQIDPPIIGLELDLDTMLAAADLERTRIPFWEAFWSDLWERASTPVDIPLRLTYSEERLRAYLKAEIASRYDQPPRPSIPAAGTVNFLPGEQGAELELDGSVLLIDAALRSSQNRTVYLPLSRSEPPHPSFQNLDILLKQTVLDINNFDGVVGLYLLDLRAGHEISFYYDQKQLINTPPDVAFTASSTIKIPIMVSAFRRIGADAEKEKPLDADTIKNLDAMISQSNNPASDWIMEHILNPIRGPLVVTADMREIGLLNTFLAGFFYQGAPLLEVIRTPANQRTDLSSEYDPYSQITPAEIGMLLADIYQCAQSGGGTLAAVWPGQITQDECRMMIQYLKNDRTPWLILAGVPDGTEVAHKHGWVTDAYGIIHDMSDAGLVFTKGGDYVLSIFLYHPVQLVFEPSNKLVMDLSRAVYNFYNIPAP